MPRARRFIDEGLRNAMDLDKYIGRVVRLRRYAFREIARMNVRRSVGLENCFLVAKADADVGHLARGDDGRRANRRPL